MKKNKKLKRYPKLVLIKHYREMNTPENARRLVEMDRESYIVSKP